MRGTTMTGGSRVHGHAEFLGDTEDTDDRGALTGETTTDQLAADVLKRFYTWLLKHYGREKRTTCVAYVREVRTFFRFLDRQHWLHPDVSYERMKDGLRELIGRQPYKTPRVGDGVARIVTCVDHLAVAPGASEQGG